MCDMQQCVVDLKLFADMIAFLPQDTAHVIMAASIDMAANHNGSAEPKKMTGMRVGSRWRPSFAVNSGRSEFLVTHQNRRLTPPFLYFHLHQFQHKRWHRLDHKHVDRFKLSSLHWWPQCFELACGKRAPSSSKLAALQELSLPLHETP